MELAVALEEAVHLSETHLGAFSCARNQSEPGNNSTCPIVRIFSPGNARLGLDDLQQSRRYPAPGASPSPASPLGDYRPRGRIMT